MTIDGWPKRLDGWPETNLVRARASLDGLSVGDAFGELFFARRTRIAMREAPTDVAWRWTDDTAMSSSIFAELAEKGDVDEDTLAERFATTYAAEPWRGYGGTAHSILTAIGEGMHWKKAAALPFDGQGSKGNGSAMRVAPVGAGAIAIAVAAARAARIRCGVEPRDPAAFIEHVYALTPTSLTRDGIDQSMRLPGDTPVAWAANKLGNGSRVCCDDTVPLCVWIAAHHLDSYEEALWLTVSALGDMDTTCAIVGGILAAGGAAIPADWLARREPLP